MGFVRSCMPERTVLNFGFTSRERAVLFLEIWCLLGDMSGVSGLGCEI